jgi:hypothetical protein
MRLRCSHCGSFDRSLRVSSYSNNIESNTPSRRHSRVIHGGLTRKRAVALVSTGPFQE